MFTIQIRPFRAPKLLPTLNPSSFVAKDGFPVAKTLTTRSGRGAHDPEPPKNVASRRSDLPLQ